MPTYQYQCKRCNEITEAIFKMAEKPDTIPCPCGSEARKILSSSMVLGDDMPAWMRHPHIRGCVQNQFEKPFTTRSEYKRVLKEKGIAELSAKREI